MTAKAGYGNRKIARCLRELSIFSEMDGVEFKPRAFEKAALAIEALDRPVEGIWREGGPKALQEIPSGAPGSPNGSKSCLPPPRQAVLHA